MTPRRTAALPRLELAETGGMLADSLEVFRACDDHLYAPYTDFYEEGPTPGFVNLAIVPGTEIVATWVHEEPDPEAYVTGQFQPLTLAGTWAQDGAVTPATRREGERVFVRGAIADGDASEGAQLFTVHSEHTPERAVRLTAMTDAGPVVVAVSTAGVASIGAGPFAGSGAVLLDSLSWPSGIVAPGPGFTDWGQTDIFFGDQALDVTYGELD